MISALLLLLSFVWAQKLEYQAKVMGLKVADICINITADKLTVKADNSGLRTLFPHINNYYIINWDEDFLPKNYLRRIHQGSHRDSVLTVYKSGQATMKRLLKNEEYTYPLPPNSRDFFSLLMKICRANKPIGDYHVDGNGRIWLATVSGGDVQKIKTPLGSFQCSRYEVRFKPLSAEKAPYVDMLTFNFLDADMQLTLWVNQGGIPIKAQLKKKLINMLWEIKSIS